MTITELRDRYQLKLNEAIAALEVLSSDEESLRQIFQLDKNYYKEFLSDLNALIQSEDKERRELLDRYTKYLLTQNTISLNPKTVDYDEMRKLVINRFLESEKGGEG